MTLIDQQIDINSNVNNNQESNNQIPNFGNIDFQ